MRRQPLATNKLYTLHPDKQPTLHIRGPLSRQGETCFPSSKMPKKREGCAVRFSPLNMQFSALVNIFWARITCSSLFLSVQRLYSLVRTLLGLSRNAWEKALPNDNSNDGDYKLAKSSVSFKCIFVISVRSRRKVSITLCSWLLNSLLSINAYYVY